MLSTYRLVDLADFILWLFEEEREEKLYNQWLHTQMTQSFKEFKKQQMSANGIAETKIPSKEEQQKSLDFAYQFIKPTKPLESEVT